MCGTACFCLRCRPLRQALRPFFLGLGEREAVGEAARREAALKRALAKERAGLAAKRKAKDQR